MNNPIFRKKNLAPIRQERNSLFYFCWFLLCDCIIFIISFVEKIVFAPLNGLFKVIFGGTITQQRKYMFNVYNLVIQSIHKLQQYHHCNHDIKYIPHLQKFSCALFGYKNTYEIHSPDTFKVCIAKSRYYVIKQVSRISLVCGIRIPNSLFCCLWRHYSFNF